MGFILAHNLLVRTEAVKKCWPKATVYSIGDAAHQASHSDHNKDSRGVVHAIDIMFAAGTAPAIATLRWLLANTQDLQYVIHNHKIYQRSMGFKGVAYSGSDPHTNHIHVSGKHGSVGASAGTGTGYDLSAENYTIKTTPCDPAKPVPVPEEEMTDAERAKLVAEVTAAVVHEVFHGAYQFNPVNGKYTLTLSGKLDRMEKKIDGLPKA
jgi:hypothetical protein